ncbi:MAG: glycoside hydrolase, partial [Spirosomaceae bacterium]|nr:glycoside hydrolase [Spirosomataceae bacterium]
MKKTILFFFLLTSHANFAQNTAKPWAYWWWMGSAVTKEGIAQNLQSYAKAGFGGMHIIPIYGVKGQEEKFIPYLSPQWLEMLDFTVQEAAKLGLSIDMTIGTGWPFGGSHVAEADAAKVLKLTQKNGKYEMGVEPTKQKVKRAAPGGEGWVVDHFDKSAL